MPEYDIKFSRHLSDVAVALVRQGLDTSEARRTVIYLSRLSIELSLKALLEAGGKPAPEIKQHLHKLRELLADVECYEFEIDGQWRPGSEIRNLRIQFGGHLIDLGVVIEAEKYGASKFPDRIRYGDNWQDVAHEILAPASFVLLDWAEQCTGRARYKP